MSAPAIPYTPYPDALPIGTILGDFTVTRVIGLGGFGIVYMAHDNVLERMVAIKEYLPITIAGRTSAKTVLVRSTHQTDTFSAGLHSFMREARLQARFSHPAMLEVYQVWEQNGTAYMAMRYYPGEALLGLRQDAEAGMLFDEAAIFRIMAPVFEGLQMLHAQSVLHRDVSPDNILIMPSGAAVLLDFGSARMVVVGAEQSLTTVLKPGYAPVEQYIDDGTMEQGPWTDVHALGAVLYFLAMGAPPPQAVTRMLGGTLHEFEAAAQKRYSAAFISAVSASLAVQPTLRLQSVAALREALGWPEEQPADTVKSMLVTTMAVPFNAEWRAAQTALQPVSAAAAAPASSDAVTVLLADPISRITPALLRAAPGTRPAPPAHAAAEPVADVVAAVAAERTTSSPINDHRNKKGLAAAIPPRWLVAAGVAIVAPGLMLFAQSKYPASAATVAIVDTTAAHAPPKLKFSTTVRVDDIQSNSAGSRPPPQIKAPPVTRSRATTAPKRVDNVEAETSVAGTAPPVFAAATLPAPTAVSRPVQLRAHSAACQRLLAKLAPSDAAIAHSDNGHVSDCR